MVTQLQSVGQSQMMGYVIKTSDTNKLIVIDGGNLAEESELRGILQKNGGKVDAWFITHPHPDHADALTNILEKPDGIVIDKIYHDLPSRDFIDKYESQYIGTYDNLVSGIKNSHISVESCFLHENIYFDNSLSVSVLGVANPEITQNAINNSSLVTQFITHKNKVLFLADLGVEGGDKLLENNNAEVLKSSYVQMAHHGQAGVSREVYEVIEPKYAFWPTPIWLWNDDIGSVVGSGPWQTLEVRSWMESIGTVNYVSYDKIYDIQID